MIFVSSDSETGLEKSNFIYANFMQPYKYLQCFSTLEFQDELPSPTKSEYCSEKVSYSLTSLRHDGCEYTFKSLTVYRLAVSQN